MATQVLTAQGPFVLTLLGTVNSAGEVVADLTTVAAGSLAIANNLSELTATADTALGNLGATAVGIEVLQAADEAAARAVLGSTVVGDAVFIAATTGDAQDALGGTSTGKDLFTAASASAARTTLGVTNVVPVVIYLPDIVAANADVIRFIAPVSGTIDGADLVLNAATATGACTATLAIGGVAVTNGVCSVTGAAGTIGAATPTAAKTVVARTSVVSVTIGGANTQAGDGTITVLITVA